MSINDPLSPIRLQLMWDRLIAVVEEQALALMRTGFSTSTREAGDLSAGVFDLSGAMLAQAVTGTPGHINSMARAGLPLPRQVPGPHYEGRRHLPDQRPVEGHRPSARLHLRHADLPARQDGRPVRLDLPCRRHRRPRHGRRRPPGLRGRPLHPADALRPRGEGRRDADRHRRRQRARADPGGGRSLLARDLQRDRLPPPDRDDGRIRHRRPQSAGRAHPGEVEAGLTRSHPQDQARRVQVLHACRRLRQADRPRRHHEDRRHRHRRRLCRHVGRVGLRHQRAPLLHRGLRLVRREMHRGAEGPEQRRLAGGDPCHRPRWLHPERQASRAGRRPPRHRPDAARRDVRLPAPGPGGRRAGRGCLVPVEPVGARRPGTGRRRSGRDRQRARSSPS